MDRIIGVVVYGQITWSDSRRCPRRLGRSTYTRSGIVAVRSLYHFVLPLICTQTIYRSTMNAVAMVLNISILFGAILTGLVNAGTLWLESSSPSMDPNPIDF